MTNQSGKHATASQEGMGKMPRDELSLTRYAQAQGKQMDLAGRVKRRLQATGLTAKEASRRAGFAGTFVRDIIDGRKTDMRGEAYVRLASVLNCELRWLLVEEGPEIVDESKDVLRQAPIRPIIIAGAVAAGIWRPAQQTPTTRGVMADARLTQTINYSPPAGYEGCDLYALRLEGSDLNKLYPPDTYLIVCPVAQTDVRSGDRVIVRIEHEGGMAEMIAREIVRTQAGIELVSHSADQALPESIPLAKGLQIIGVVIGDTRQHRGSGPVILLPRGE